MVETPTLMEQQGAGYYGRPMIKPPEWTDLIPTYFFTGGLAGAAASLAFTQRLGKNGDAARALLFGAAGCCVVSGICLIADLKRPERFANMLRVFKPTSPMSVGVYIFSVFGGATTLAAGSELTGIATPLGRTFEAVAALLGPPMSVYTAVLIGDTVVPAWHYARKSLPIVFGASSAMSAGGLGLILSPQAQNGAARRLGVLAAAGELVALECLRSELGPRQHLAYKRGEAEMFEQAARVLTIAGALAAVSSIKLSALSKVAGAMLLAASLCERFAIFRAGCESAKDPSFTIDAQRSRSNASPAEPVPASR